MIQVVVGDLAFVTADALVRPTTTRLEPTSSALRNLERLAGPGFQQQLTLRRELAVGAAIVTGGGELDAEFVIHAVLRGPDEGVSEHGVRRALLSALQRAADWQFPTIAMPPLGTGPGNLVIERTATIAADVLIPHLAEQPFPADVVIVVGSEEEKAVFDAALAHRT